MDYVLPGTAFRVTGFDFDVGMPLSLHLVNGDRASPVGEIIVGGDGTIETTAIVPPDFPQLVMIGVGLLMFVAAVVAYVRGGRTPSYSTD